MMFSLVNGDNVPQKHLSRAIDRGLADAELMDPTTPEHLKAHLQLTSVVGADAWLHASPSRDSGSVMEPELFRLAVARRLRLQLLDNFATCPCCGSGMDVYLDHALVCSCGGDRTLRHNAVRDQVFSEAIEFGLRVQREKAGLLPPRPGDARGSTHVRAKWIRRRGLPSTSRGRGWVCGAKSGQRKAISNKGSW